MDLAGFIRAGKTYRLHRQLTRERGHHGDGHGGTEPLHQLVIARLGILAQFFRRNVKRSRSVIVNVDVPEAHHRRIPGQPLYPGHQRSRLQEQIPCRSPGEIPPGQPALPGSLLRRGACAVVELLRSLAVDVRKDLVHKPCVVAVLRRTGKGHFELVRRHPSVLFPCLCACEQDAADAAPDGRWYVFRSILADEPSPTAPASPLQPELSFLSESGLLVPRPDALQHDPCIVKVPVPLDLNRPDRPWSKCPLHGRSSSYLVFVVRH